jgi:hypothetical protein
VRPPPTASMRSASERRIRTGPNGTPSTWWRSRTEPSCRHERTRHRAERIVSSRI